MENKELKVFYYILMKRLKRKRAALCQQFLNIHHQMAQNLNSKKKSYKNILALESCMPESFFQIKVPRFRSIHRRPRRDNFMRLLQQSENNNFYYEFFRMNKDSFNLLCDELATYLPCPEVFVTPPLPIRKQVALCLYKLASCDEYRVIGDVFGVHKSTVHKYFHIVIKAILQLRKKYINFPKLEEAKTIATAFEKLTHIPNVIGAIDRTHIPVWPSGEKYQGYINQKGWPSIVLQTVVDNKYLFRDVSVKFPGCTHDATVFRESGLFKYSSQVIPTYSADVNGLQTPFMLIGDPAYPLLPWLLTPYTGCLDLEEESCNSYICSGHIVVEKAFDRLKCRWRCLPNRMDIDPEFVPNVVLACAILHNFVETEEQRVYDSWSLDVPSEFPQPQPESSKEIISEENSINPQRMREDIKNFLKNNFPLRRSHF